MANNYTEIMALVNAGNKMGLSNTITRDYGIPLDFTSVHENYDAAVIYAAENKKAYVDQIIATEGVTYIVTAESNGKHTIGEKEYDVYIKPVGVIPGFEEASVGTLPQKAADGSLTWVPISAIVEGDGNNIIDTTNSKTVKVTATTIKDTEGNDTNSVEYDLEVKVSEAEGNSLSVKDDGLFVEVPETDLSGYYTKTEADEKFITEAYDDTELSNRVEAVETIVGKEATDDAEATGLVKTVTELVSDVTDHETRLTNVETFFNTAEGDSLNEALDTLVEIQEYIQGDGEAAQGLVGDIAANRTAIETLNGTGEGSVSKAITDAISTSESTAAQTYATKTELSEHAQAADEKYAVATDVQNALNTKIDTATITHTSDEVQEGATVAGTTLSIVVDAYKKSEVYTQSETLAQIDKKITDMTGGESAADVLNSLNTYKQVVDAEVWGSEKVAEWTSTDAEGKVTYTPVYTQDSRIDTIEGKVNSNTTLAQKGVDDAAAVASRATALETTVGQHTTKLETIDTQISEFTTAKGTLETKVSTIEGQITALQASDTTILEKIGIVEGNITTLTNKDAELSGLISANTENISKNASDISTLSGNVYTKDQVYTKSEVDAALENLDQSDLEQGIADNKAAIEAEVTRATAAEEANLSLIHKLMGYVDEENKGDVDKSVRTIAAEEINTLIGAVSDSDTIENITHLVTYVNEYGSDTAELITKVDNQATILSGIGGIDQPATVLAAIESKIAQIPEYELSAATDTVLGGVMSSNEVTVSETGVLGLGEVSTDKLVQGTEILILYGGNAEVETA